MLRVRVNVDVEESVRRGKPAGESVVLSITDEHLASLSELERQSLARAMQRHSSSKDYDRVVNLPVPEPTIAGLLEAIGKKAADYAEKVKRDAEGKAKAKAIFDSTPLEAMADAYDEHDGFSYRVADILCNSDQDVVNHLKDLINADGSISAKYKARLAKEADERDAAHKERMRLDAEREATELRERLEWIAEHGSERLKRMASEDIEHTAVYRDERLAHDLPGWKFLKDLDGDTDQPRNPTLDAFEVLDIARNSLPDCKMMRYYVEHEHDDCEDYDDCPEYDVCQYVAQGEFLGHYVVFM